ncbi:MAG: xanthine dehydrogenase molybdopterin binding subunit [Rhodospirillaceae bacterium]|nr:xanthine dehydrogenase molybdopterin binding subunit [Rhodospirillaceae bacterium]|tara:strand:+ start:14414 stop:16747 length:2334 start_codon:yes stop_codon:yes gene_type:complete
MSTARQMDQIKGGVHTDVRHDSAVNHVTGRSVFIDDMPNVPGTLHGALVKSPHAHAVIKSIDLNAARELTGVHAVLVADDIPGRNDVAPIFEDEPILAKGLVEYIGHPIAAIAADSMDIARAAASMVVVEYEELEPVLTIDEALERESYTSPPQIMRRGDSARGISDAPHQISGEVRCGGQDHFYLESHIALAVPQEDRDMLVYSSTQHPTEVQHGVATVLGLPVNAVTTEIRRMGGGFGGKESQSTIIAALAALMADKTRQPVKLRLARDDDMVITGKRHDFLFRYEVGFDDTGRIEGIDILMASRAGNVADLSSSVLVRALCHGDNAYYLPNAHIHGYPCKTNTVSNTGFRGFGGPQGMVAIETVIDHIAQDLGTDSDDVRRANYYDTGDRDTTHYGQKVTDNIITEIVDSLSREIDYPARKAAVAAFNQENTILKKGIALMPVKFGISFNLPTLNQAGALVHVYTDGSVHLNHGGTEMGQGLYIKVAQVVASTFQIDIDNVKISSTNTAKVPNTSATAASSGSDLNGMAAHDAATQIRDRMAGVAAEHFEVDESEIEFRNNRIYARNDSLSFAELAQLTWEHRVSLSATGFYSTPDISWDDETMTGRPFYYFSYGACVSEVVIDTLTGENRVLRSDILQDCGRSLNPAIDLGQIEGAFVQGMGWLTMEELWWDEKGALRTHGPSTYKIPGSRDVPPEFNVHILEDAPNREPTIFRSKAIGEPPLMLALSVWLALRDAVASVGGHGHLPNLDAPATAEAVLMAVADIQERAGDGT